VLNSKDWNKYYTESVLKYIPDIDPDIDFRAVKRLNKLVETTNAKVILSSSWRFYLSETINRLRNAGFKYRITDIIKGEECIYNENYPEVKHPTRGDLIANYLKEHPCDNYIIIDDVNDMTDEQQSHLVQTTRELGFTDTELKKSLKLLK
jgi:hypothetical protein